MLLKTYRARRSFTLSRSSYA